MRTKLAAFLGFNAYWICIVAAFFNALPELFRLDFRSPQSPFALHLEGLRWDHRYLPFLLLSVMATSFSSVLTGAIVKNRGGSAAAKSAIPLILLWTELFFLSLFTGTFGFAAISLTAVPLTVMTSSYFGHLGERIQRERFPDATLFGIYPYHFIWIVFPLFIYGFIAAFLLPRLHRAVFRNWFEEGFAGAVVHLFALIYILLPFLGLAGLLYIVYHILAGKVVMIRSEWAKAFFTIGLLFVVPIIFYRLLLLIGKLMRMVPLEGL